METDQIIGSIYAAINDFVQKNHNGLQRGISEQNLSLNLAVCLRDRFVDYDVEPEYNLSFDKPNDRKVIHLLQEEAVAAGKKLNAKLLYRIKPDIILHRPGSHEHNLCVIEVKKDVSPERDKEFDHTKLRRLTTDLLGNNYNYRVGVLLTFGTGAQAGKFELQFFQGGQIVPEEELR